MVCPLYRGCPLLRGSNHIILIGRDKFGDLVLSIVERYLLIQCPFLGGSSLRGSTVFIIGIISGKPNDLERGGDKAKKKKKARRGKRKGKKKGRKNRGKKRRKIKKRS